ncbi:MAG: SusC/RagA family TonB-linked outer membrane protein [Gemmatimonadaceae bacterium]
MKNGSRLTRLAAGCIIAGLLPAIAAAQGVTLSGRVTNATSGTPLANASVSIPTMRAGATTDAEGRYNFTIPAANATGQTVTVSARRLGYLVSSVQVQLSGTGIITDFRLTPVAAELVGVVITGLGTEREKSQLGTAQQELSSRQLNQTKTQSILNSIQGKVSGVSITASGTQGGSNRILLRGANSISGNNSPLFIVDGVPVSNDSHGTTYVGGWDYGSAIADINPEDIASMTILKGPNAAAIYGSRAANGVIILTTKKGNANGGRMRTELSSTITFDRPDIIADYQNLYGQGSQGEFMWVDGTGNGVQDFNDQSFGPRLDGRTHGCTFIPHTQTYDQTAPCLQFTSPTEASPWIAHPDNVSSFYQTGHTLSNSIAMSGGTDHVNARISFGSDQQLGYIPNNTFHKTNGSLNATVRVNDKLSADASLQFIRNTGQNRPGTGYTQSVVEQFIWFGRQVDMAALKAGYFGNLGSGPANGPEGREYNWNYSYHNNPYWLQYSNPFFDARDHFIGSIAMNYNIAPGLAASIHTGSDIYRFNIDQRFAPGDTRQGTIVDPKYFGGFRFINDDSNDNGVDGTLKLNRSLGSHLQVNGLVGGTTRRVTFNTGSVQTGGLTVPDIYNVSNAAIPPTLGQALSRRRTDSFYGSAAFTLNNWWTVEGTARNDWSSTLPKENNSYFYPSVNTSIVLSDMIPSLKGNILNYLKVRGSVAQVGADADPYLLRTTYSGLSTKFNGLAQFTLGDALANGALKPEITHSDEFGLELGLFDSRVTFDGSLYNKYTKNQIFNAPVSNTTGFTVKSINAGRITNKGIDFLFGVTPIQSDNGITWNTTFNYGRNKSRITELAPGVTTLLLGSLFSSRVEARLDEPYGALMGRAWARDSATGKLLLDGGLPYAATSAPTHYFGTVQPTWTGGLANTLTFKNLRLYGLLDFRRGGKIASITNMWGTYTGVLASTVAGRDADWNKPGIVVDGIDVATGKPNTVSVDAETYYQCRAYNCGQVIEDWIYDASYTKLRELTLTLDLPRSLVSRLNVSAITLGLTGRNLAMWTKVPNIDPEFSYQTGNNQGIESMVLPNTRSWGFNVRITQ